MFKFGKSIITCLILAVSGILFTSCACSQSIKVESIVFDSQTIELFIGDVYEAKVNVLPFNAQNNKVVYSVVNMKNNNGLTIEVLEKLKDNSFLAKNAGEATLYATSVELGQKSTVTQTIKVFDKKKKLDTPTGLKFDGEKVVWDKVTYLLSDKEYDAMGYIVNLNGQDLPFSPKTYLDGLVSGIENNIKVKATELESKYVDEGDFSNSIKVYILNSPKNITKDNNTISWEAVEYASSYDIYVNDELFAQNITGTSYDIDFETSGNYAVSIVANPSAGSEFRYPSYKSEVISIEKLDSVESLTLSNNIVTWNEVVKAVEYKVVIENNDNKYLFDAGVYTSFDLSDVLEEITGGEYKLSVIAVSNNTSGINSKQSEAINITKLNAPTIFSVMHDKIVWEPVENAVSYMLKYNDSEVISVDTNEYTLPLNSPAGTYNFKFLTVGDGNEFITSKWTEDDDVFIATKLDAPISITNQNTTITSNTVENAISYVYYDVADKENIKEFDLSEITAKNAENGFVSVVLNLPDKVEGYDSYEIQNHLNENHYVIKMKAVAQEGSNFFDSNISEASADFYKLFQPDLFTILYSQDLFVYTNLLTLDSITNEESKKLYEKIPVIPGDAGDMYVVKIRYQQYEDGELVDRFIAVLDGSSQGITQEMMSKIKGGDIYISMCYSGNGTDVIDSDYYDLRLALEWVYSKIDHIYGVPNYTDYQIVIPRMYDVTDVKTNGTKLNFTSFGAENERFVLCAEINGMLTPITTSDVNSIDLNDLLTGEGTATLYIITEANDNTTYEGRFTETDDDVSFIGEATDKLSFSSNAVKVNVSRLSAPLISLNSGLIEWEPVENATGYEVYVNGRLDENAQINEENGLMGYYCNDYANDILSIMVVACVEESVDENNLIINSLPSNEIVFNRLSLLGYDIQDGILTVDTQEEDVVLNLIVTNVNTEETIEVQSEDLSIDLSETILQSGDYKLMFYISLKPNALQDRLDSYIFGMSTPIIIKVLENPGMVYNQGVLSWYKNSNAVGYKVAFKDKQTNEIILSSLIDSNKCDLTLVDEINSNTLYDVCVIAVGDGIDSISSHPIFDSNSFEFIRMQEVQNLTGNVVGANYVLTWDAIENATYEIYLNNEKINQVSNSTYSYSLSNMQLVKDYDFAIRVVDTLNIKEKSNYSKVLKVTKLNTPQIRLINGELVVDNFNSEISNISLSVISGNNIIYTSVFDNENINLDDIDEIDNQSYDIEIKFVGDNQTYLDSDKSTLRNLTRETAVSGLTLNKINQRIEWESVDGIDTYKVVFTNGTNQTTLEKFVSNNYIDITSEVDAGNIVVKVYSVGNNQNVLNSKSTSEVTFTKLASPKNFRLENSRIIFDKVDNVDKYNIKLNKNGEITETDFTFESTGYVLDLNGVGNYVVSVYAKGDYINTVNSDNSEEITIIKLGEISNINSLNNTIVWDAVENAVSYKLQFNGPINLVVDTENNLYKIEIDRFAVGTYDLSICAVGDDGFILNGETSILDGFINILPTVTNINLSQSSKKLVWDANVNALSYVVEFTDEYFNVTSVKADVNEIEIPTELLSGVISCEVVAVGNGANIINSAKSNTFTFTKLEKPNKVKHNNGKITIQAVDGIENYVLEISFDGNVELIDLNTSNLEYNYDFVDAGEYNLTVHSKGNYVDTIDSDKALTTKVVRLSAPTIVIEDNIASWEPNVFVDENRFGYKVTIYKGGVVVYDNVINQNEINFDFDNMNEDTYSIEVQALAGDNTQYLPSEVSVIDNIIKFKAPVVDDVLTNSKVTWTYDLTESEILSLVGYEIKIRNENGDEWFETISNINTKEYEMSDDYNAGKYFISVRLLGDGQTNIRSLFSNEIEVYKLESPVINICRVNENLSTSPYMMTWDNVTGATSYIVVLNNNQVIETNDNYIIIDDMVALEDGLNSVRLKVNGDNVYYLNSKLGDASSFVLIDTSEADLRIEKGLVTWNEVENAKIYLLQINERMVNCGNNTSYELGTIYNSGEYSIKLKIIAKDTNGTENVIVNSKYSNAINCNKLQTPSAVQVVNGELKLDKVEFKNTEGELLDNLTYQLVYGNYDEILTFEQANSTLTKLVYSDRVNVSSEIKYRAIGDDYNLNSNWSNLENVVEGIELNKVEGIKVENGVLIWDTVPNAVGYALTGRLEGEGTMFETYVESTRIEKPFYKNDYDLNGANFEISIVAIGTQITNGSTIAYTNSKPANYGIIYLPKVSNIVTIDGVLVWESSSENGYELMIDNVSKTVMTYNYDFSDEQIGKHIVKIRNNGNGKEIIDSVWSDEEIVYKLSEPQFSDNICVKNGYLTWKTNSEFTSNELDVDSLDVFKYIRILISKNGESDIILTKDGIVTELADNVYSSVLSDYLDELDAGNYVIRIKNIGTTGNNNFNRVLSSVYSNEINICKLSAPMGITIEDNILQWNNVENNDGYEVIIGDEIIHIAKQQNDDYCKIDLSEYPVGDYKITIRTLGDNTRYLTSQISDECEVCKLSPPKEIMEGGDVISVVDGCLTWASVDKAVGYTIKVKNTLNNVETVFDDVEYEVQGNRIYYELPEELLNGEYKVVVKSLGNGKTSISSQYSTKEKSVVKLQTISGFANNLGKLVWRKLEIGENNYIKRFKILITSERDNESGENSFIFDASTVPTNNSGANLVIKDDLYYFEIPSNVPVGKISIKIKALGLTDDINTTTSYCNSSYSNALSATKLDVVKNIEIRDGLIRWTYNGVGREGFYLAIEKDGVPFIDETNLIKTYSAELSSDLGDGAYMIYVIAVGNTVAYDSSNTRYITSNLSKPLEIEKLKKVNNFKADEGKLVWDKVDGASKYELSFYRENQQVITVTTKSNVGYYEPIGQDGDGNDLFPSGTYEKVTIRALGGVDYISSQEIELGSQIYKLTKPNNLEVVNDGANLRWQIVTYNRNGEKMYVTMYKIKYTSVKTGAEGELYARFNNEEDDENSPEIIDISATTIGSLTDNTFFELNLNDLPIGGGDYLVAIQSCALANSAINQSNFYDTINSDYSPNVAIKKPSSPKGLMFDNDIKAYTWDKIEVDSSLSVDYIGYYIYSSIDFNNISDDEFDSRVTVGTFETSSNYFYPIKLGYYKLVIKSKVTGNMESDYIGKFGFTYREYAGSSTTDLMKAFAKEYGVDCQHNLFNGGDGSFENPYKIRTVTQFNNMNYYYIDGIYFDLIDNINLSNTNITIGTKEKQFAGIFNGNNFTISGISLNGTAESIGLFAYVNGGTISNVKLNASVSISRISETYAGLLVGYGKNVRIENVAISGSITQSGNSTASSAIYIGGAVGYAFGESTSITKVKNTANIVFNSKGTNIIAYAGGIVGYYTASEGDNSGIIKCGNEGQISGTICGGLVGYGNCPIVDSYNIGKVQSYDAKNSATYAGGLIGRTSGIDKVVVTNCYNIGDISAVSSSRNNNSYAGGVLGYGICEVEYFYNKGNVTATKPNTTESYSGWIVGFNFNKASIVDNCYNVNTQITSISGYQTISEGYEVITESELIANINSKLNNHFAYSSSKNRIVLTMEETLY